MANKITIDDIIKGIKKLNFHNLKWWGVTASFIGGLILGNVVYWNREFIYDVAQEYYEQSVEPTIQAEETLEATELPYTIEPEYGPGSFPGLIWNIRNLGRSTWENHPEEIDYIAQTFCGIPLVGIQEFAWKGHEEFLLDNIETIIEETCDEEREYVYSIRPQDDPEYDENHVFFYDPEFLTLLGTYQYPDENDYFVRPPFGAHFKVKNGNFDFILILYHIKPDDDDTPENETYDELLHLNDVHIAFQVAFPGELDIMSGGDMNAGSYLNSGQWEYLLGLTDYTSLIEEGTSLAGQPHDKILVPYATMEDIISAEVFDFGAYLNLSEEETEDVSDHYPLKIIFYTTYDTD